MSTRARAFTLIEMIVVVAIIVALSGILVPVVTNEMSDSKLKRAHDAVNHIATAIDRYMKDTGVAPTGKNGRRDMHWLYSTGQMPMKNAFDSGASGSVADFLTVNSCGVEGWRGPYLPALGADPWGTAYIVNVHAFFTDRERVW
ncbi:MAG TPA: prepilin-type N-terminal cleavage/methylation domain-containing protein, partial [Pirellulaceae bacterium]|nr:prepilin-type N-terminal cleavage/methylation domain-containing protein [Pirellulaceae bacterium]